MPTNSTKEQCSACKFWKQEGTTDFGQCHRHPPTMLPVLPSDRRDGKEPTDVPFDIGDLVVIGWPPVNGSQWCGEFKRKQKGSK